MDNGHRDLPKKKTRIPNSPLGESSHLVIGLKNPCDNESSISWLWLIYDINKNWVKDGESIILAVLKVPYGFLAFLRSTV